MALIMFAENHIYLESSAAAAPSQLLCKEKHYNSSFVCDYLPIPLKPLKPVKMQPFRSSCEHTFVEKSPSVQLVSAAA